MELTDSFEWQGRRIAVDQVHAAFTKSVMLHVTVWTRAYLAPDDW